jgi:hypothetical protein
MQNICSKCGVATDYSGDLHCRKNFVLEINKLLSFDETDKARLLFYTASFDEDWKKLLLRKIGGKFEKLITTEQLHREYLSRLKISYQGISLAAATSHRITHCYNCKSSLDNSINMECNICGWIICGCGACGCGYSPW